jgi:hypothetical protein
LTAIAEIYSFVRAMMFRAMFRPAGFNGGFNATGGPGPGFSGPRQFGGGFGFGPANYLTIIGLIITIVGVVWLGLALRQGSKPQKA